MERYHVVVFDTETTGLSDHSLVIQLAYIAYDKHGKNIFQYKEYWKLPDGATISPSSQAVHNISHETLVEKGVNPVQELQVLEEFYAKSKQQGTVWVAHNASFDKRLIMQTATAWGVPMPTFKQGTFLCTMTESAKHVTDVYTKSGRTKTRLKNGELYSYLHKGSAAANQDLAHDAFEDCKITAGNYFEGHRRGWW